MPRHAPGPWTVDKAQVLLGTQDGDEISDAMGNRVCEVSHLTTKLANARLIAAAPELLEALQQCLQHIELDESMHGRPFGAGNVAREAIKKATGE